jgi:PAS domain S-box-containing protein
MAWQETPYAAELLLGAVVAAGIIVVGYRSRDKRGAVPLVGILTAAFVWCLADAVRLSTTDIGLKLLMNNVRFLGPILVTVSVFLFAAEYTNRDQWLTRRRVALVCAPHALTLALVWTNQYHELVRTGYAIERTAGLVFIDIAYGPWYYVHATYSYLLLIGAAAMLVAKLRQSADVRTYRYQTLTILVAQFVPWGMNAAFVTGLTDNDLTPLGFTVTGLLFAIALFRYRILDLVPIARSTVVDNIDEGYLVLDTTGTVVDVNETASEVLGVDRDTVVGMDFEKLYADFPSIIERFGDQRELREQITLERDGETRYYDIDISPIYDGRDNYTGRVVIFRDVTERERRKRQLQRQKDRLERQTTQLERQNERLEDFASIVSHDLRNPLNVVSGRLELARRSPDPEHFDEMEAGLERMETIIDDVLTLARQGQTVSDRECVSVADLADEAWTNVETAGGRLVVEGTRDLQADRQRLLQVFENLFRNAVEHGSTSPDSQARQDAVEHGGDGVTVTVGVLSDADGFYVEDDGPGIPEAEREKVLRKGYTNDEDGTGFGLAIVETAVEAHGWEIDVTESDTGGARFEIRTVESGPVEATGPVPQG